MLICVVSPRCGCSCSAVHCVVMMLMCVCAFDLMCVLLRVRVRLHSVVCMRVGVVLCCVCAWRFSDAAGGFDVAGSACAGVCLLGLFRVVLQMLSV